MESRKEGEERNPADTFQRIILSICIILAPALLMGWFSLCPQYGNPQCPTSADPLGALVAFRSADPSLMSVFLTLGVIIPYAYPLSYLGLGLLTRKRSWKLSTLGIVLGWFGSIPWGLIGASEFIYYDLSRAGNDAFAVTLLNQLGMHWQIVYVVAAGWVIGHQAAYVLLGIAFWRTRAIPKWASILMVASAPIMGPIAYGIGNGWLQVAGYGLVLVASIPASIGIFRSASSN